MVEWRDRGTKHEAEGKRPPMTAYQRDPAYGMVLCVSWPRLMSATA